MFCACAVTGPAVTNAALVFGDGLDDRRRAGIVCALAAKS